MISTVTVEEFVFAFGARAAELKRLSKEKCSAEHIKRKPAKVR